MVLHIYFTHGVSRVSLGLLAVTAAGGQYPNHVWLLRSLRESSSCSWCLTSAGVLCFDSINQPQDSNLPQALARELLLRS